MGVTYCVEDIRGCRSAGHEPNIYPYVYMATQGGQRGAFNDDRSSADQLARSAALCMHLSGFAVAQVVQCTARDRARTDGEVSAAVLIRSPPT